MGRRGGGFVWTSALSVWLLAGCGGGSSGGYADGGTGVGGSSGSGTGGSSGSGGTSVGGSAGAGTGGSAGAATGGSAGAATGGSAGASGGAAGSAGSAGAGGCTAGPNDDQDGDGFSIAQGDCNDCEPKANPGAVEVMTPTGSAPLDDDCDGTVDNVAAGCDGALALDSADPLDGARAIDLCKSSSGANDWGVVSAQWTEPDGSAATLSSNYHLGHGNLSAFGTNVTVQTGARMLGLSSGTARQPTDPGYQSPAGFDKMINSVAPAGYPKESPACPGVTTGTPHDAVALELVLRTPTNAVGFAFDFKFYTHEWPTYVCSAYNDFFLALVSPTPTGLLDGNVSFDAQGNPFSVNTSLLDVCTCAPAPPCTAGGVLYPCNLGAAELAGTGFEDHAATPWLTTSVPVQGGSEITLRFTVYDSGDGILDSTTLVDNFTWLTETAPTSPTTLPK